MAKMIQKGLNSEKRMQMRVGLEKTGKGMVQNIG